MPLGIKWCPCVTPCVKRRRLSCCLFDEQLVYSAFLGSVVLGQSIISVFLLVELNEVPDRLKQGPSQSLQRIEMSNTRGDETDASQGRRKVLSKKTYLMKKVYVATELGRFFCDRAIRCCEYAQPLLLPVVPKECVRAHPWAP